MRDAQALELPGLLANALDVLGSNKRLVIFNLSNAIVRHCEMIRLPTRTRWPEARAAISFTSNVDLPSP